MANEFKANIKLKVDSNLKLDDLDVSDIVQIIENTASEEINKELQVSALELQNQARLFLSAIKRLDQEDELVEEAALKQVAFKGNPETTNYQSERVKAYKRGLLQQKYLLAMNFEKYLDAFRGVNKERYGIYVLSNSKGKLIGSYEISLQDLLKSIDERGYFQVSGIDRNNSALEEQSLFDVEHIEEAKRSYEGVYNRLERYYAIHNKKGDSKTGGILLWKNSKGWQAGKVLNYGDVKEAYITFLFDKHRNQLCNLAKTGNAPYYGHAFIGRFYDNYINQVTNLAAVVQEDLYMRELNKQYAIKSKGSHLWSLGPYYKIAESILQVSNSKYIDKKMIENKLKEQNSETKRNMKIEIEEIVKDELLALQKEFH